jgi:DNA segregation ATPase FtsK/SpoIIIE-like protein
LFREVGADRLEEYRDYVAKVRPLDAEEVLPRVLVVVDEFQVMFADDDAIAHECARLLDHVVRQGRAFGIHLVLGTQTLRGQGTMSLLRGTLDQVAVRIVLKTGESDSRLFLGDDNPAASRLSRRGEAIFNPDGGRPEGNMAFQVAFTSDESRDGVARRARRRADESGFTRRPLVFDGTRKIDVTEDEQVAAWLDGRATPDSRIIRAHVGLPVAIGGSGAVELSRRAGRNLAIVHRDGAITSGSALVAVVTAMRSSAATPRISIIECLGSDEEHAEDLARLGAWRGAVTWGRWRKVLAGTLAEAAAEVRRRVDADDYGAQPWLLVINALQRARVLDAEPSFDETGSPQQDLMSVLADGSDVGVHVIVTADSVEAVDRRLGPGALDQFGARLIGQCSEDASQRLLGSIAASRLGPAYALLDEPEDSRRETLRPFPMPAPDWVAAATRD